MTKSTNQQATFSMTRHEVATQDGNWRQKEFTRIVSIRNEMFEKIPSNAEPTNGILSTIYSFSAQTRWHANKILEGNIFIRKCGEI